MNLTPVEIPAEHVEFFNEFGAIACKDEQGMLYLFPTYSGRRNSIPLCINESSHSGCFYINKHDNFRDLRLAAAAAYNVAELMDARHREAGCI